MLHHITQQKAPSSIRVEDHIIDAFASFRQWDPMDAGAPRKELHVVTNKKCWDVCYVCSQEFVHPQFQWLFLMAENKTCSFLWCCCVMPCKMWPCPTIVFQNYVVLCRSEICTTSASLDLDFFFMGSDHGKIWAKLLSNFQVQRHFRFDQVAMCETSGCAKINDSQFVSFELEKSIQFQS